MRNFVGSGQVYVEKELFECKNVIDSQGLRGNGDWGIQPNKPIEGAKTLYRTKTLYHDTFSINFEHSYVS
jgi:hypothetical protein